MITPIAASAPQYLQPLALVPLWVVPRWEVPLWVVLHTTVVLPTTEYVMVRD